MKTFAAASACALALFIAGAVSAADYRIPIGDLDLSSPQGAAHFDRRVSRRAGSACSGRSPLERGRCRTEFRAEARGRLPSERRDDYARARPSRDAL